MDVQVSVIVNANGTIFGAIGKGVSSDPLDVSIANVSQGQQLELNLQVDSGALPLSATMPLPFAAQPGQTLGVANPKGEISFVYNSSTNLLPSSFPLLLSTNGPASRVSVYMNLNPKPIVLMGDPISLTRPYQPVEVLVHDGNLLSLADPPVPGFLIGPDQQSLLMSYESRFAGFAVKFTGSDGLDLQSLTFPAVFAPTADSPTELVLPASNNTVTAYCTVPDRYLREFSYTIQSSAGRHDPTVVNNPDSGTHG